MRHRRAIRTVLVYALLGSLATVLNAWAIGTVACVLANRNHPEPIAGWPAAPAPFAEAVWSTHRVDPRSAASAHGERITTLSTGLRTGHGWRVRLESALVLRDSEDPGGATIRFLDVVDAGWPARAMRWGNYREAVRPGERYPGHAATADLSLHGGMMVWRRPTPGYSGFDRLALPLVPLWSGFAVNTALHAAALFVLAWLVRMLARLVRRALGFLRNKRGRCPTCGYDRAGLGAEAPCPECGPTRTAGPAGA